jgi:hypothetical protein
MFLIPQQSFYKVVFTLAICCKAACDLLESNCPRLVGQIHPLSRVVLQIIFGMKMSHKDWLLVWKLFTMVPIQVKWQNYIFVFYIIIPQVFQ